MENMDDRKPNKKERQALSLFYNRFYDLYDEMSDDDFFINDSKKRLFYIKDIFSVYKELLSYEPIQYYLNGLRRAVDHH